MKKLLTVLLVTILAGSINAAVFSDSFDDGVIGPEWTVASTAVESGGLLQVPGGNSVYTTASYEGDLSFGIRNFYDSRNLGDYSEYTLGYVGYLGAGNLLARNDNQGGGQLVIQTFAGGSWVSLTSIYTGDYQYHDIDVSFEWQAGGVLITMDDLATPGIDVQTLVTYPQYVPVNNGNIWINSNGANLGTWDVDFVKVVPEPGTMLLLGIGTVVAIRRRCV